MPEYEDLLNEYDELSKQNSASRKSGSAFGALDNNKKNNSPLDNIKSKAGSAAMQAMGVPKPIANIAANKFGKNGGLGNTPNALKNRRTNMPGLAPGKGANGAKNNKDDSANNSSKSNNSTGNPLNSMINSNQNQEMQEKSTAQRAAEGVATKGASAAMQAAGVPKFIADGLAKKFGEGPGLKILLIGIGASVFFFFLIIILIIYIWFLPVLKGLELIDDVKEGMGSFMDSAGNWFSGNGWCANDKECEAKAEEKFYNKVKELSVKYPRVDMSLVMASVLYSYNPSNGMFDAGNSDYCSINYTTDEDREKCEAQTAEGTSGTDGYQEAKDNLSKVAKKLSKGVETFDNYMVTEFIPNNYSEMMKQENKTAEQILKDIYSYSSFFSAYRKNLFVNSGTGVCSYTVDGVDISDIKVRLLECSWNPSESPAPIPGEELVDFEKYIMGVTYAESYGFADEEYKAQAIAARSFSLTRGKRMAGVYNDQLRLEEEDGKWILQVRNCTADHVYCDPDKGCWSDHDTAGDTVYSGYEPGHGWSKEPLAEDDRLREAVKSVRGMVLVDGSGNIINTAYTHTEQTRWDSWADNGMDYTEILKKEYTNGKSIVSNCSVGATGDWANWRQWDPRWASVPLGGSTLGDVGCLMTSFAIQIAHSGTAVYLPAGVEFNPGTFVKYSGVSFRDDGWYYGGDPWTKEMAPGFVRHANVTIPGTKKQKVQKMAEYINQGYYPIIQVKYAKGTHFVAIVGTSDNDLIMADPATSSTYVFATYPDGAKFYYDLDVILFKRTD